MSLLSLLALQWSLKRFLAWSYSSKELFPFLVEVRLGLSSLVSVTSECISAPCAPVILVDFVVLSLAPWFQRPNCLVTNLRYTVCPRGTSGCTCWLFSLCTSQQSATVKHPPLWIVKTCLPKKLWALFIIVKRETQSTCLLVGEGVNKMHFMAQRP